MGEKQVKIVKLKCFQADDGDTDECIMFHNGGRIWPPSGVFSVSTGNEVPMNITKQFGGDESMRFSLRDDDDIGSDSLGFVDISRFQENTFPGGPDHEKDFEGGEGGSAIISFRSGPAYGDRVLELIANTPSGERRELIPPYTVNFQGEETGANIRVGVNIVGIEEGLYWIDVLLDGETYTRMPLRIIHEREEDDGRETKKKNEQ